MIKFLSSFTLLFLFVLFTNINKGKGQEIPHSSQQDGPIKFSGVIGHGVNEESGQRSKVLMAADVSQEKIKKECSFFGGDSLNGFDFKNVCKEAELDGAKMYFEFKAFMYQKQAQFIKKKYRISALPFEIEIAKSIISLPAVVTTACNNLDFENGNFTGWVTARGYNMNSNNPLTIMATPANLSTNESIHSCNDLNIISSAYGSDPIGGFTGRDPNGGAYSARIGGYDINTSDGVASTATGIPTACPSYKYWNNTGLGAYSNGEQLSQSFLVTAANALVSYDYAVLLNDGGHANGEQPYFHVAVTNASGTTLAPAACNEYFVQATAGVPPAGFTYSGYTNTTEGDNTKIYKQGWVSNSINLTPYIGQTVTIKFSSAGCIYGGHMAWAYIDATCGPAAIIVSNIIPCAGSNATLTAPAVAGGSYIWSGPGISGSTTKINAVVTATGTYSVLVTPSQGSACKYTLTTLVTFASVTAPISSSTDVDCWGSNTGAATVNPSGGNTPYSYTWSNGKTTQTVSGLPAGNYTVTIKDAGGCTKTTTVAITQPAAALTNTASAFSNVNCFGNSTGSATSTAANGTSPYSYLWSNGQTTSVATGLGAANYTVTVTDNKGCTKTSTVTISQPTAVLSSSVSVTNVACSGNPATATVTPAGGTLGYTYLWSPGAKTTQTATGLATGTYTVLVTDSKGCTSVNALSISVTSTPSVSTSSTQTGCSITNGTATAIPSGGPTPYTYLWSPGGQTTSAATGLSTGSYTITLTNASGCTKTNTVSVTKTSNPNVTASSTPAGCTVANGTATAIASGGTGAYTYFWSPGGKTFNPATGLAANTYTILLTDNNGCTKTNTVNISATAPPVAAVSNVLQATCGNNSGSASASSSGGTPGYAYLWSPGGATSQNISGLAAKIYTVTVTDMNGCTDAEIANVTNADGPDVTTSVNADVLCFGEITGSATAIPTGGTPSYTYLWANGQTTKTATGLAAGTQIVKVTDINGCVAYFTAFIAQPTFSLSATVPSQTNVSCSGGNNGNAIANASGGTPGYTFLWSNGQTTQTATGLTMGLYTVGITDAHGCTTTASVTVTEPTALTTTASSQTNVFCNGGNNGDATINPIGGTPGYTFLWSNGQTAQTATGLVAGNYSIITTDNKGCTTTSSVTISQPATGLSSTVSPFNVSCNGGNNATATLTPLGGTPAYTFLWNDGQTTQTATGLTMGLYTAAITDANGCATTTSVIISEPAVLTSTLTLTNVYCNGGNNGSATVNLSGGTPGYTFAWSNGQTTQTATGITAGTYTLLVSDSHGCSVLSVDSVSQPAALLTPASQTNILCNGLNTGIASVSPSGGTPNYTFAWSNGQTTAALTGIKAGNYSVTTTDANGCSAANAFIITEPALLTSIPSQTNIRCNGDATGTASVIAAGGNPAYTYNWSNGETTSAITGITAGIYLAVVADANGCVTTDSFSVAQPSFLNSLISQTTILCHGGTGSASVLTTGGSPAYTYNWNNGQTTSAITGAAGNYSVVINDANGCADMHTFSITEPLPLSLALSGSDSICPGATSILTAKSTGGTPGYTYAWAPGPQNGQSISVSPTLSSTYTVNATDANGCSSLIQTFTVTVLPAPTALFDTVSSGMYSSIFSFNDLSSGGASWLWDFGDGSTSTLQNPIHTFSGAGVYSVTQFVFNQFGCPDTFRIAVGFNEGIIIPNVFTPDGDGMNDVWYIPNSGMSDFHVEIFDRWGLKVFETTADEIRWDGRTPSGTLLTDGTYYFVLKAVLKSIHGNKDYSTKGNITLLTKTRQ